MTMILEIEGIHSGYGPIEILHGISLHVKRSEIVSVIGPNGSGKSTAFKTIMGFLVPTSGRILFKGLDTIGLRPDEVIHPAKYRHPIPPLRKGPAPLLIDIAAPEEHGVGVSMDRSCMGAGLLAKAVLFEKRADSSEADDGATNSLFHRGNLPGKTMPHYVYRTDERLPKIVRSIHHGK